MPFRFGGDAVHVYLTINTAGPLAGVNGGVVLLVDGPSSPAVSYATAYKGKVDSAYVVGGEAAVSRATADSIADRLGLRRAQ